MRIPYITVAAALLSCAAAYAQTVDPVGTKLPKAARAHVVSGAVSEADWLDR